jgi:DNA-binding transcriptional LysR family regulator
MDLRRLKTFVTVAEHGTVSKAADVLHITQPALSRQINGLEQELGFELFQRAGRRLLLTPRGEQLLGDCRSLLAHAGTVGERAQALRRGELKVLKVATSALTIEGAFPIFLHRYAERFPGVRLALIEADAAEHLTMLEQGEADLAISVLNVVPVDEHRFASYLLPLFQLLAACAPTFDMEETDTIEIRRLVQHPLLLPNPTYATRNVFDAACRLAGVRPNVLREQRRARAAGARRGGTRRGSHPLGPAHRPQPGPDHARDAPPRAAAYHGGGAVGQAAHAAALCRGVFRASRRARARDVSDAAAVTAQGRGGAGFRRNQAHAVTSPFFALPTAYCRGHEISRRGQGLYPVG